MGKALCAFGRRGLFDWPMMSQSRSGAHFSENSPNVSSWDRGRQTTPDLPLIPFRQPNEGWQIESSN